VIGVVMSICRLALPAASVFVPYLLAPQSRLKSRFANGVFLKNSSARVVMVILCGVGAAGVVGAFPLQLERKPSADAAHRFASFRLTSP
jgi:D-serine dehydratase